MTKQAISIALATTVRAMFYVTLTLKTFIWLDHLLEYHIDPSFLLYFFTCTDISKLMKKNRLMTLFPRAGHTSNYVTCSNERGPKFIDHFGNIGRLQTVRKHTEYSSI